MAAAAFLAERELAEKQQRLAAQSAKRAIELREEELQRKMDKGGVEALFGILKDDDRDLQLRAINKLAAAGDERSVVPLLEALGDAFQQRDRKLAEKLTAGLRTLGSGYPEALVAGLSDEITETRWAVAEILGDVGNRDAIPALTQALDDPDEGVRDAASVALERIESRSMNPT